MKIIKWPRTPHLPWSAGRSDDDIGVDRLPPGPLVVTEKLDGECTTMTQHFVHARSGDSADHASRHEVKRLWGEIGWRIPLGMYLVGENLTAKHSIYYPRADPPYFYLFAVHMHGNVFSWDETKIVALMLGLPLVGVSLEGDSEYTRACIEHERPTQSEHGDECEGYVVRSAGRFSLESWGRHAAKYVRADHVQTDDHWLTAPMVRNGQG